MAPRIPIGTLLSVDVPQFRGPIHVRTDGPPDAPVLLMLHGFSGSMHWFDRAVPLLADAYRVIRVDLVGHGSTGGRAADAPVQVAAVRAVLDQLDVEHVTALGHSFGADVAVGLAEASDRVEKLIIVTQAPDYSDATLPPGSPLMTVPVLSYLLASGFRNLARLVGPRLLKRVPEASRVLAEQALSDVRALDPRMFMVVLRDRRDRMRRRPLDEQARDAGKPTLVILGGKDHFYGDRSRGRYERAGAEVVVLPDATHSPLVEIPEETVGIIRRFLGALDVAADTCP